MNSNTKVGKAKWASFGPMPCFFKKYKRVLLFCNSRYMWALKYMWFDDSIVTDVLDKLRIIVRWYVATYLIFMGIQLNIKVEYHMD